MKNKLKTMFIWAGALLLTIALFGFVNNKRQKSTCRETLVELTGDTELRFIDKSGVLELLYSKGFKFEGNAIKSINLIDIELELERHPAIKGAEAFFNASYQLVIQVEQRSPLLRILDSKGDSYYLDEEGEFMPLLPNYTARVPVASGSIYGSARKTKISTILSSDSLRERFILDDLFIIASEARKDSFIWCQLEQLNVLPDQEIEFIPVMGPGRVLLGDSKDIANKFKRLELFYQQGLPQAGWNAYTALNLKYNNQIICTQNTN